MELNSKEFKNLTDKAHAYKFKANDWSDWGLLFRFLIVICYLLAKGGKKGKKQRKVSEWNKFLGEQMRAGKTIKEAAVIYRERKVHG